MKTYVSKLTNMRALTPPASTDDPDIRMAQSVMDYILRSLALNYLARDQREALGILSADERIAAVEAGYGAPAVSTPLVDEGPDVQPRAQSVPVERNPRRRARAAVERPRVQRPDRSHGTTVQPCGVETGPAGICYV